MARWLRLGANAVGILLLSVVTFGLALIATVLAYVAQAITNTGDRIAGFVLAGMHWADDALAAVRDVRVQLYRRQVVMLSVRPRTFRP